MLEKFSCQIVSFGIQILLARLIAPKKFGWIIERTFTWLNRYRRLARGYEKLAPNSEAAVQIAMIQLMSKRIKNHF